MKRIISIILIAFIVLMVGIGSADTVTRKEFANQIRENSITLMKAYRDFYERDSSSFNDAHLLAMYSYYKMYLIALEAEIAETVLDVGLSANSLIRKESLKLSSDMRLLIERTWNEWLSEEYSRDDMIRMLIAFIDGAVEARGE